MALSGDWETHYVTRGWHLTSCAARRQSSTSRQSASTGRLTNPRECFQQVCEMGSALIKQLSYSYNTVWSGIPRLGSFVANLFHDHCPSALQRNSWRWCLWHSLWSSELWPVNSLYRVRPKKSTTTKIWFSLKRIGNLRRNFQHLFGTYTVNHKKRATLFLIITLAFLSRFLYFFLPVETGRNILQGS